MDTERKPFFARLFGRPVRRAARHAAGALQTLRRGRRATAGNITVEFGFLLPFLIALAIGTYDFGNIGLQKITVTNAARAGTQYGVVDLSTAGDTDGMKLAARLDADDVNSELTINARQYCLCSSSGEVSCTNVCTGEFDDSTFPVMFVEVTVQDSIDLMFVYPGISSPQQVAATSTLRVR